MNQQENTGSTEVEKEVVQQAAEQSTDTTTQSAATEGDGKPEGSES